MKKANEENKAAHVTTGSVFDDLEFTPEEALELKIKAEILRAIIDRIDSGDYTQAELVRKLKVHQPDVSNLMRGKISKFSISRLIQFAARLSLHAEVKITAPKGAVVHDMTAGAGKRKRELAHA